jgi:hypothetical protein
MPLSFQEYFLSGFGQWNIQSDTEGNSPPNSGATARAQIIDFDGGWGTEKWACLHFEAGDRWVGDNTPRCDLAMGVGTDSENILASRGGRHMSCFAAFSVYYPTAAQDTLWGDGSPVFTSAYHTCGPEWHQAFNQPGGQVPVIVGKNGNPFYEDLRVMWLFGSGDQQIADVQAPYEPGHLMDFVIDVLWESDANGYANVYCSIDKAGYSLIQSFTGPTMWAATPDYPTGGNYIKLPNYQDPSNNTSATVLYTRILLGDTFNEVARSFGGGGAAVHMGNYRRRRH